MGNKMKLKGAEILVKALEAEGVDTVFGYPGGAIMPVYDALVDAKFKHILVRHEQAAALAADGYARATGKVGVCLATSGPGATNLVTGIANAYMDSVPIVAITGQVSTSLMGTDAFQEVDIFGISMPVVKHSFLVRHIKDLTKVVSEAFRVARSGRPGPVLIDLPKDVANAELEIDEENMQGSVQTPPGRTDAKQLAAARELLAKANRPVIYCGGGVRIAKAWDELRAFAEATRIPVVMTLQGLGSVPGDYPLSLGMLGMHGTRVANMAVQQSDLLVCVGARFDDRVTGKLAEFAPNAKVIHMDIDPAEVGKLRAPECAIVGDIKVALNFLHVETQIEEWTNWCVQAKADCAWNYDAPLTSIYAPKFIRCLSDHAPENTFVTCDVGQHQMWVAQHYKFNYPNQHLTSGGLGTMGFGLPAAIGVALAVPDAQIITVSGDGSIMMNVQELATLKRYKLPVKIVLFDNQTLGMVRQWQELFFNERYSEVDLSDNPDFDVVAQAFGIPSFRVTQDDEIEDAVQRIFAHKGPLLVHVPINPQENVWPLVPPGKSNEHMMEAAR
jgi:acetolactate synthase-1/2/3 large subunit